MAVPRRIGLFLDQNSLGKIREDISDEKKNTILGME